MNPIQLSYAFHFNADIDDLPSDILVVSSDNVCFAVHSHRLLSVSANNFANLLAHPLPPSYVHTSVPTFPTEETSDVLNVVLHSLYGLSCDMYKPPFECIAASVPAFKKYGLVPLESYLARGTPLFNTLLYHAPLRPIETYALAAADSLEDLAVASSAYALTVKLYTVPNELIEPIPPTYLARLIGLQGTRMSTLKTLLEIQLYPHTAKPYCSAEKRREVSESYKLACAKVYYDATPGQP